MAVVFNELLKIRKQVHIKFEMTALNCEAIIQKANNGIVFLFLEGSQGEGLKITIDYEKATINLYKDGKIVESAIIDYVTFLADGGFIIKPFSNWTGKVMYININ